MESIDQETLAGQAHLLQRREALGVRTPSLPSSVPVLPPILCRFCGTERERLPFCEHIARPCLCAEALLERDAYLESERLAAERKTASDVRVQEERRASLVRRYSLEMPEKLRRSSFDNFVVQPHTMVAYEAAMRFVARAGTGRGLMLLGDVGVGKTHLAAAIANSEIAAGRSVLCGTVPDLLSRIKASYGSDVETEQQVMRPFFECSLLVLDDLGKEKISAFVEEKVYQIINHRCERDLRVVVTTNVGMEVVQARYAWNGKAIVSRLFEMCEGVYVKGPDYRRQRRW